MNESKIFINRIYKYSLIISMFLMILSFLITNQFIYSMIVLIASTIGVLGFYISIKTLDRFLKKKKGKPLVFLVFFLKLIFITISFYPVSHISEKAIIFYITGISVIVMAMMLEAISLIFRYESNLNKEY